MDPQSTAPDPAPEMPTDNRKRKADNGQTGPGRGSKRQATLTARVTRAMLKKLSENSSTAQSLDPGLPMDPRPRNKAPRQTPKTVISQQATAAAADVSLTCVLETQKSSVQPAAASSVELPEPCENASGPEPSPIRPNTAAEDVAAASELARAAIAAGLVPQSCTARKFLDVGGELDSDSENEVPPTQPDVLFPEPFGESYYSRISPIEAESQPSGRFPETSTISMSEPDATDPQGYGVEYRSPPGTPQNLYDELLGIHNYEVKEDGEAAYKEAEDTARHQAEADVQPIVASPIPQQGHEDSVLGVGITQPVSSAPKFPFGPYGPSDPDAVVPYDPADPTGLATAKLSTIFWAESREYDPGHQIPLPEAASDHADAQDKTPTASQEQQKPQESEQLSAWLPDKAETFKSTWVERAESTEHTTPEEVVQIEEESDDGVASSWHSASLRVAGPITLSRGAQESTAKEAAEMAQTLSPQEHPKLPQPFPRPVQLPLPDLTEDIYSPEYYDEDDVDY